MPSVYPITFYASDQRGPYPHMAKRDAELWERYLQKYSSDYLGFSYDVALGGRRLQIPTDDTDALKAWQYTTALKVDVIGWKGNQAWLIEVRPDATVSALGAAITYTLVARREAITALPIIPAILCDNIQLDVEWACQQLGVQILRP